MKKIFFILSVVLILIMATVSCFAVSSADYQIPLEQIIPFNQSNFYVPLNGVGNISFNDEGSVVFYNSSSSPYTNGFAHYGYITDTSHRYLYICNITNNSSGTRGFYIGEPYVVRGYLTSGQNYTFTFIHPGFNNNFWVSQASAADCDYIVHYLNVFDLTILYGSNDNIPSDQSEIISLISTYVDPFSKLDISHFVRKSGYFDPLQDFWLSFFHLFDYFPQLISTYSGLFVFVTICLSLCLVTFIVVMVIKRCRNI